jgi:hypothetical protein
VSHPLHLAVAEKVYERIKRRAELVKDKACGGEQHVPLFSSPERGRDTQLCKVDLLVVKSAQVRVILEIEESGFSPTKICGKLLTSALSTHFIHNTQAGLVVPYADRVLFVQVLDGSKFLKPGSRKREQCELIEKQIRDMLTSNRSSVTDYRLFLVSGPRDKEGLRTVADSVVSALA